MKFSADKCKMMYFAFKNPQHIYTINNKDLHTLVCETVSEEKNRGIIMKIDKQVAALVAKANKMLGMTRRSFKSREEKMLQLYKSVLRPHVEFAISS